MSDYYIVIPARYGSSRLPGKPLLEVAGKPLVVHALENAQASSAKAVVVATDDERIAEVVRSAGGAACMTDPNHPSGTDRIAEVAEREGFPENAIIVNLQGDEPCVPGSLLDELATMLDSQPGASLATMATPITSVGELFDPNVVKVVLNDVGYAHYFSRAPIPFCRDAFGGTTPPSSLPEGVPFLRHLGLYAYRLGALRGMVAAPPTVLEEAEKLEQLRALAMGMTILVKVLERAPGHGVDTLEDLERVRQLVETR